MNIEATPRNGAGEYALSVYRRTLEWARGDNLVQRKVRLDGEILHIDDLPYDLMSYERIILAGAGKASVAMARGIENVLGDRIDSGLIVTKHGHSGPLKWCRVIEAGHPIPDEASLKAGEEMLALARTVTERDLVLFVLSGGASALLEAPSDGVSLDDLVLVNRELLKCGADISLMNAVRSRLSRVKAGGLAVAFERATTAVIYMSDVEGDRLSVIGSGLFVPTRVFGSLTRGLAPFKVEERLPPAVLGLLHSNPRAGGGFKHASHRMVGSAQMMRAQAITIATGLGLKCSSLPVMTGAAREFPIYLAKKGLLPTKRRVGSPQCSIGVGETVVQIKGEGRGGRAQEMACVFADQIAGDPDVAVLIAGSDGTDGPTDAAGALVDGGAVARANNRGFTVEGSLAQNDSYHFHAVAGTLLKTGPTGTNLNDILIVVRT